MATHIIDKITDLLGNVFTFKDNSGDASSHTHNIANVTGLQTALDGKLDVTGTADRANWAANADTVDGYHVSQLVTNDFFYDWKADETETFSGTAAKATADASGNTITSTYATKSELSTHNTDSNAHSDIRSAIPAATSELTNDSGFITNADLSGYETSAHAEATYAKNSAVSAGFNNVGASIYSLGTALDTERDARVASDESLQGNINSLSQSVSDTNTALNEERDARIEADGYIREAISTKYTLPSGGIPKGDLDSAVQESLGKADTALQLDVNETVVVWIDSTDTVDGYTSTKNALDNGKLPCTRYGGKIYICISAGAEGEFSGSVNFVSVDDVGAHCLLCNGMASQTGHYCNWALVDYGFKTKQTAKSDPSASGTTLTAIATITQNANGDITATKKTIQDATTGQKGVMKVGTGLSASSGTVSVSYGTASGTACQGNDSRLSDSRTPKSHTHAASEITSGTLSVARGGTGQTSVANIQAGKDGSGNTITSTYLPQSGKSVLKNSVTSTLKGAVLVPWNATANIAISTLINNNCGVQAGVDGTVYVILNIGSNTKTITGFAGSSTSWELVKGTCMTCVRYGGSYYREDN